MMEQAIIKDVGDYNIRGFNLSHVIIIITSNLLSLETKNVVIEFIEDFNSRDYLCADKSEIRKNNKN